MTQITLPLYPPPHPCARTICAIIDGGASVHGLMRAADRISRRAGFGVCGRAGDVTVFGYGMVGRGGDQREAQAAWVAGVLL